MSPCDIAALAPVLDLLEERQEAQNQVHGLRNLTLASQQRLQIKAFTSGDQTDHGKGDNATALLKRWSGVSTARALVNQINKGRQPVKLI